MPITRKSARAKGMLLQRIMAHVVAFVTDTKVGVDTATARSGTKVPDVQLSPKAQKLWPFHIECKNARTVSFSAWWAQTVSDAAFHGGRLRPMLIMKLHGSSDLVVTIRLMDYIELMFGPLSPLKKHRLIRYFRGVMAEDDAA